MTRNKQGKDDHYLNYMMSAVDSVPSVKAQAIETGLSIAHSQLAELAFSRVWNIHGESFENGDITQGQLDSMVSLEILRAIEVDRQTKGAVLLSELSRAYEGKLYAKGGFTTIQEWLDSIGITTNKGGRITQILGIVTFVIPYCKSRKIKAYGENVDEAWFRRFDPDNRCIVNTATIVLSDLRKAIKKDDKKEVARILEWIANTKYTNKEIKALAGGYKSDTKIRASIFPNGTGTSFTGQIHFDDEAQLKWFYKQMGAVAEIQQSPSPLYVDQNLVWISSESFKF